MTTERIAEFFRTRRPDGPCLVVDREVVRDNYTAFRRALPNSDIFYAVKANPAPQILELLAGLGSNFDCASVAEIEMALEAGATADRISFGNTIKKERDIARAYALGVNLFAVDCHEEVEKISRAAPGARVFCRVLTDGEGAEWPLSRKFGCVPAMAVDVLVYAHQLGLASYGVSCRAKHADMPALARPSRPKRHGGKAAACRTTPTCRLAFDAARCRVLLSCLPPLPFADAQGVGGPAALCCWQTARRGTRHWP